MYVDNMPLDEAREWRAELLRALGEARLTPLAEEQLRWDLEDVERRIRELEE